jgi:hypothetical protein
LRPGLKFVLFFSYFSLQLQLTETRLESYNFFEKRLIVKRNFDHNAIYGSHYVL